MLPLGILDYNQILLRLIQVRIWHQYYGTDNQGVARPQGDRWDIGAHEFVGASSPRAASKKVSTTGNDATCQRNDFAKPCLTFSRAYTIALAGDIIEVAAGNYAAQTIPSLAKGSNAVVFRPVQGGSVVVNGLTVNASYVEIYSMRLTDGALIAPAASNGRPSDVHHVTFRDVSGKNLFIVAEDVLIQGGDFGGFDGCVASNSEDVVNIWQMQSADLVWRASSRVTIDGVTIHDITDHGNTCDDVPAPAKGRHVDGMQILAGHFITIKNSRFYNNATSNIIARPFRETLNDLVIENNFFAPVLNPGSSVSIGDTGDTITGTNIFRYNTVSGGGNVRCANANCFKVENNILDLGSCGSNVEYTNNVFPVGSVTCGTKFKFATPQYVGPIPNPGYLNGLVPNYHLAASDFAARDFADLYSYPATDFDNQKRFSGAGPDAGADEYVVPSTSKLGEAYTLLQNQN